jgi:transposase
VISYGKKEGERKAIYVGVDLHRKAWHVTIMTKEVELFSGSIPGCWESLKRLLERYDGYRVEAVYEAGYFGFWLYDLLASWGAYCIVTPPSLIPREYGNHVKTDRKDSGKLAVLLSRGLLKKVWIPTPEQRCHRQVIRTRRQLITDRVRAQLRIKAQLRFYGIEIPEPRGKWSQAYLVNLRRLRFEDRWLQQSFRMLLDEYSFLSDQIKKQTELLKELSETDDYRESVEILRSLFGIGLIAAMEILLEIGDFTRFKRSSQIAAYVGLTPSQYSSGDKIRMGRITGIGKNSLRAILVEVSWKLITRDKRLRQRYEELKIRRGGKRAIVAIARRLCICIRAMMIDGQPYAQRLTT